MLAMLAQPDSLATVFRIFDHDRSGGISLDEFCSAVHTLGISLPRSRIAEMFKEAIGSARGELDYPTFCKVVAQADGGAEARMLHKMYDDGNVRTIYKERCRPTTQLPDCAADQLGLLGT